jgi:PST family polysaccharide transporter
VRQRIRDQFAGRPMLRRIIKNFSWLSVDSGLTMLLGLVVGVWMARYLSPERYGLLNYALAFVGMWGYFATLGLGDIVVRDLLLYPQKRDEILGTAFVLLLAAGIITIGAINGFVWLVQRPDFVTRCLVTILSFQFIFKAFEVLDYDFSSRVESKYTVWTRVISQLSMSLIKAALILLGMSLVSFAWAFLTGTMAGTLALVIISRWRGCLMTNWKVSRARALNLLSQGWPLIFSGTFALLNITVDKILLREYSSVHELGLFSAAARLSQAWYFFPVAIGGSVAPALTKAFASQFHVYRRKLQAVYDLMTAASVVIALCTSLLARPIIALLFGSEYHGSAAMFSIHIWSSVFLFHVSIRGRSLIIEGNQRFVAILSFAALVVNIVGNLLLVPRFGGVGASYASLLSWAFCALVVPLPWRETRTSVSMFMLSFLPFTRYRT